MYEKCCICLYMYNKRKYYKLNKNTNYAFMFLKMFKFFKLFLIFRNQISPLIQTLFTSYYCNILTSVIYKGN